MKNLQRAIGGAASGAVAIIAVLLLLKPLLEAFVELAKQVAFPLTLIVGLILLGVAAGIFQRMTRR